MRMTSDPLTKAARVLARRLNELGRISDDERGLTRTYLSPAMARANQCVGDWMGEAGLSVRIDRVGNLIGRQEAPRGGKTLLLGSHLDTVRNAGRFDGALGVLLPILALAELRRRGRELPFAIEVVGFAEEESVRFSTAYIGSKGFTGRLRARDLNVRDVAGISLRAALETFNGGAFSLPKPAHSAHELIGYVEVHIEQGPVLEDENLAVGVVAAIASQTRGRLVFRGKAGHAGTTPMALRRDALAGAAEFISLTENFARGRSPLVATVGMITVADGAANVIPGEVTLTLDVRHPANAAQRRAVAALVNGAGRIARRRGLACVWHETMQHPATPCSPRLASLLQESVRTLQGRSVKLVSGAGHDAVVMAALTPVAMLFVRCRDGLSHHPAESASPADLAMALGVIVDFLERLADATR